MPQLCVFDPQIPVDEEVWYRYEDVQYASSLDEFDNPQGDGRVAVDLRRFRVLRHTPKGTWIDAYGEPRFVLRNATKHYACPTEEEAKASFVARKNAQIRIYNARIHRAQQALLVISGRTL
jgi:hypothetical protein